MTMREKRTLRVQSGGAGRGATLVTTLEKQEAAHASGKRRRPAAEFGTSISAWHAMACAAGLVHKLRPMHASMRGKRSAMDLDLNPFDGDGIGWDLDQMADLAKKAGIGANMRVPTYVGVVDLRDWHAPPNSMDLPGHRLIRVDTLSPEEARLWAIRSSCQRPVHQWEGTAEDGPQWADGGFSAPSPLVPLDMLDDVDEIIWNACSPFDPMARREKRTVADVRPPAKVVSLVIDQIIDRNFLLDLHRFAVVYPSRGIRVEGRCPRTMAEAGIPFDLTKETQANRLGPVGDAVWLNVTRWGPWK